MVGERGEAGGKSSTVLGSSTLERREFLSAGAVGVAATAFGGASSAGPAETAVDFPSASVARDAPGKTAFASKSFVVALIVVEQCCRNGLWQNDLVACFASRFVNDMSG